METNGSLNYSSHEVLTTAAAAPPAAYARRKTFDVEKAQNDESAM
jgi:hypothetical protein